MPELPEVESLRRSLIPSVVDRRVIECRIVRHDVCDVGHGREVEPEDLLLGTVITELRRHGKQLALIGENGRSMCFGLGMTGAIEIRSRESPVQPHTHVHWFLDCGRRMDFIDPRRFGGVHCFGTFEDLMRERWRSLGPDALLIKAETLGVTLRDSRRVVKAALLDQSVIAGVGNIYADESLFRSGVDPRKVARRIDLSTWGRIVDNLQLILREAIDDGGSTIRDYRSSDGAAGRAQDRHLVYGRGGAPCVRCNATLRTGQVAQRTTVWCANCQQR